MILTPVSYNLLRITYSTLVIISNMKVQISGFINFFKEIFLYIV